MATEEEVLTSHCRIDGKNLEQIIDEAVINLCQELRSHGKQCFLVGGATRDLLMGQKPKDWDLTTDATPDEMMKIFEDDRVIPSGIQHGTITVLKGGEPYEITTFRTEGAYSDGRRPDFVEFTPSLEEDLKRRDLTINAIAYDPIENRVVTTPNDGIKDLENRVVKAVGDPSERFQEDGLRTMRVCRFASRLNFDIDEGTMSALKKNANVIDNVSAERIRDELVGILKQSDKPSVGIECLRQAGLLRLILPELDDLYGLEQHKAFHQYDVYEHTMRGLDSIPREEFYARLGYLFHDTGKKLAKKWSDNKQRYVFSGHEEISETLTDEIMKRLKFSKAEIAKVRALVGNHMIHDSSQWSNKAIRKLVNRVGEENIDELLVLHYGDLMGKGRDISKDLEDLESLKARIADLRDQTGKASFTSRDLAISGHDVMKQLNIPPSPEVGKVLTYLTDRVLDDPSLNNEKDLLRMMDEIRCK